MCGVDAIRYTTILEPIHFILPLNGGSQVKFMSNHYYPAILVSSTFAVPERLSSKEDRTHLLQFQHRAVTSLLVEPHADGYPLSEITVPVAPGTTVSNVRSVSFPGGHGNDLIEAGTLLWSA